VGAGLGESKVILRKQWRWKGLHNLTPTDSSGSCFPERMSVMPGWTEEASDAAGLSHAPAARPRGITACVRGTAETDQSSDWHVVFHLLELRSSLRTCQVFPAGLGCPVPSGTVMS